MDIFQSKYKVLDKIGEGSFSEVLKCEFIESGICYAAKRLKKIYKTEDSIMGCAEIIAAQKLPYHPNILNMFEYHYDSFYGKVTFIFEVMDMSMHDYLKTKTRGLSEHRVKNYLLQILKGLEHLHRHGLFHRDVKPENILIKFPSLLYTPLSKSNPEEIIKLADLGSVRGIFSAPPYTEYISTRWYRSPECLLTVGNYGSKMDIWAAGCVFFEMLTLRPLFPGSNEIDQLSKIHHVLGSPSIQFLSRLKSKSRNCVFFPKLKGTGTDVLLPFLSRTGKCVLRLMVEYNPEKRINVNRLLRNSYFDDLREQNTHVERVAKKIDDRPKVWYRPSESLKRSMGDDGSLQTNINIAKAKILKREHFSDEPRKNSKGSGKSSHSTKKSTSIENRIEIPYYKPRVPIDTKKINLNKYTALPVVDYNVCKTLGEIPTILKSKVKYKNTLSRNKPPMQQSFEERFFKTTSNLDTMSNDMDVKTILKRQFQSKSFVLPRRLGQHKLKTINDAHIATLQTKFKKKVFEDLKHK